MSVVWIFIDFWISFSFGLTKILQEATIQTCCGCIKVSGDESFMEMMNFGLLSDPIFVVFALSNLCTCLGFYVPYFCLADKAKMYNMSTDEASYLLATIGIANTIGRIVLGYISDKPWVNRLLVYSSCLFACGLGNFQLYFFQFSWRAKTIFNLFVFL